MHTYEEKNDIIVVLDFFYKDFGNHFNWQGRVHKDGKKAQATLCICVVVRPPCKEGMSPFIAVGRSTVLSLGVASEPFTASLQHIVQREARFRTGW